MQGRDPPSLAAAVFDWPAAPGFAAPAQPIPADWREQFISQHVLSSRIALCGLFKSCGVGRQWVLARAPSATLTLNFSATAEVSDRLRQLSAVRRDLLARSSSSSDGLLTKLVVVCDEQCAQYGPFSALPHALADCGQAITELQIKAATEDSWPEFSTASALVAGMAAVCPRLKSLSVGFPCLLPTPAALPCLTELQFQLRLDDDGEAENAPAVLQGVARLLPQLSELHATPCPYVGYDWVPDVGIWEMIFTPQSTTHTLTSLTTSDALDLTLLRLILEHAPALRCLEVYRINLYSDQFAEKEWQASELYVENMEDSYCNDCLTHLPRSSGQLTFTEEVMLYASCSEVRSSSMCIVQMTCASTMAMYTPVC